MMLQNENKLHLDIASFKRSYKIELIIEEHQNSKIRITHNALLETVDTISQDVYLVAVTMNNFLINNLPPDLVMEQLAQKCRKPLEHITFYVNRNWQLVGIYNHQEILDRWLETKTRLQQEYTGDVFLNYINSHEEVLKDADVLLRKLKQDTFLSQFFFPLYSEAFNGYKKLNTEQVKFLNIEYDIDVVLQIDPEILAEAVITIVKTPDVQKYSLQQMPVFYYTTKYTIDTDMAITAVHGSFENHGRKFFFNIDEYAGLLK